VKVEDEQLSLSEAAVGEGLPLDQNMPVGHANYSASQRHQRKRLHDGMFFCKVHLIDVAVNIVKRDQSISQSIFIYYGVIKCRSTM